MSNRESQPEGKIRRKLLYVIEGNVDIRLVQGIQDLGEVHLMVPASNFVRSGLKERMEAAGIRIRASEIPGGRWGYQIRLLFRLFRHASECDVILVQEMLRAALDANIVGAVLRKPVICYIGIPAIEYFSCRRRRRQISVLHSWLGHCCIHALLWINGTLSTLALGAGPYLREVAGRTCSRTMLNQYYGVDTDRFRPVTFEEKVELRNKWRLPEEGHIVFLSIRMTHEKDPETALIACDEARRAGYPIYLVNFGGDYRYFVELARSLELEAADEWIIGRPAVNPLTEVSEIFRLSDVVMVSSLEEGAAMSTLEGLSCEVPVVATRVGGMAVQLDGYASLTELGDPTSMAEAMAWIFDHPDEARERSRRGREYILREWDHRLAFQSFEEAFETAMGTRRRATG